jgi:hypothetical protein
MDMAGGKFARFNYPGGIGNFLRLAPPHAEKKKLIKRRFGG